MDQENRVIVLIDMDCFYCQVEEKLDPELKGKPIAVVQYNPWKGGGIIAVNYVARARGVTRHMRGDEAKEKCPEIQLPSVPCQRGKADISKYREAGKEVARVLQRFTPLLERASIDEAYLDITAPVQERLKTLNVNTVHTDMMPNTYALGYDSIEQFISDVHNCGSDSIEFEYEHAKRLLVGAVIVSEIRAAVYDETGYRCSAGISHNKILAKLVCGMNKPNKQTVLPKHSINILYKTLSVKKVKHLGGKFGDTVCEVLRISKMCELQKFTEKELQARFDEKNGTWLYNIARGVDLEPVQARFNPKSIGCCKQLRGKSSLHDLDSLKKWLRDLGDEIEDRLEKDALEINRTPKQMVVSFSTQGPGGRDVSSSRSYNFVADDELCGDLFASKALELVLDSLEGVKHTDEEANRRLKSAIKFLGISVGKFEDHSESKKTRKIVDFFAAGTSNTAKTKKVSNTEDNIKKNEGKKYLLQKYFQAVDKSKTTNDDIKVEINTKEQNKSNKTLESALDKQESFFAKLLNKDSNNIRPTTPQCNIVQCGDNSNDSNYSGSTIDIEINKSIALFEDDPQDVDRVSNMRELMNNSLAIQEKNNEDSQSDKTDNKIDENLETEYPELNEDETTKCGDEDKKNPSPVGLETFKCTECGRTIQLNMFETHADYHFALKLREEERKRVRDEKTSDKREKTQVTNEERKKNKKDDQKNNTGGPIASFFVKIDDTIPTQTCTECKKKIPVEKISEHLDFHEAQKLNRELNRKSTLISNILSSSVKRKRKSLSPKKASKLSCTSKSIDSFFR